MARLFSIVVALLLLAAAGWLVARWAMHQPPEFYVAEIARPVEQHREANDELLASATALASNVRRPGRWHALFTADQINGWLAVDLPENHPDVLGSTIAEPRVRLAADRLTLACQYNDGTLAGIVSLELEVYLPEPNLLAVEIHGLRAGKLPLPMTQLLVGINRLAEQNDLHLRWDKRQGRPVALLALPAASLDDGKVYRLLTIELRPDEVYLAGITAPAAEVDGLWSDGDEPHVANQPLRKLKLQR